MAARKNATATHVSAVTNSYMSPQGSRCTASPLVSTPAPCPARPTQVSTTAMVTQNPTGPRPSRWSGITDAPAPAPAAPPPAPPRPAPPGPAPSDPAPSDPAPAGPAPSAAVRPHAAPARGPGDSPG